MNLTEAEARTKVCHKSMTVVGESSRCNCIASRCMAWRWRSLNPDTIKPEHRTGYCGLAGEAR